MNLATLHHSIGNLPGRTTRHATANQANGLKSLLARTMGRLLVPRRATQPVAQVDAASQVLERGQIATIARPGSQKIICEVGSLWLTQDGRGKDIVLEAGQEFQCDYYDRNTRLLVYALSNARWQIG